MINAQNRLPLLLSIGLLLSLVITFFVPQLALAQVTSADLQGAGVQVSRGNLLDLLALVVRIASSVAGIIAFIYVLYAGFSYILSGGDAAKASKAVSMIMNAVIGLIIIALSYSIISFTISRIGSQSLPAATTNNATTGTGGAAAPVVR